MKNVWCHLSTVANEQRRNITRVWAAPSIAVHSPGISTRFDPYPPSYLARHLPVPYEDSYWENYLWFDALIDNGYYRAEFGWPPEGKDIEI